MRGEYESAAERREGELCEELSRKLRENVDDMALAVLTGAPVPGMEKIVEGEVVEDEDPRLAFRKRYLLQNRVPR